jgi:DNA-binding response OmpR family regulator
MSSQLCDADAPDGRRAACTDRCRAARVLVSDGWLRHGQTLVVHDHDAWERWLERTVRLLLDRLAASLQARAVVHTGPLVVDLLAVTVRVGDRPVRLSPAEWRVLERLAACPGALVSRPVLIAAAWDDAAERALAEADMHRLRVVVARLRRKLGPAAGLVETHAGLGYRLLAVDPEVA